MYRNENDDNLSFLEVKSHLESFFVDYRRELHSKQLEDNVVVVIIIQLPRATSSNLYIFLAFPFRERSKTSKLADVYSK